MKLYFQGGHLPTYRNILKNNGVQDISLSYFGLRQRTKFTKGWDISKYFPDQNVFVDSGCATINSDKEQKYTNEELREIAEHYYSWTSDNYGSLEYFTEFDARQLGNTFLEEQRNKALASSLDKFVPVWGADSGLENLRDLAERFGKVGILQTTVGNRDLVPYLNRMVSNGVKLFGLSMTKPDIMQAIPWESVSSTSWISPMQYGDTIIWSHNQLKRYPKKMKDQARKKERSTFLSAGFDYDKIQADDAHEMLRVSIWSWGKQVEAINRKTIRGVTAPVNSHDNDFSEFDTDEVGGVVEKAQKRVPTARPRDHAEKRIIPFLDFEFSTEKRRNEATGEMENVDIPKVKIRSESMRICDTCFLAAKCPMFEENSTCAYDIPIQVRTREQAQSLMDSMVEMQAQRVLFMKMAEDAEGGYADPNLSSEIDRLGKLMEKKHNMEQEGFSLTVTAKQQGNMNRLDNLFGDLTNFKFGELEAPIKPEETLTQLGVQDTVEYFEEGF